MYVISGELEFEVGGADGLRFTVPAGSFVRKPAGIEHCFWNATGTPCEYIELSAGERFQQMVEATGAQRDQGLDRLREEVRGQGQHETYFPACSLALASRVWRR